MKPRLLIVEDQVGDRLKQILGAYDCTVIETLGGFWPLYEQGLDEYFDAALVDLHLTSSYSDNDGLIIVDQISRSSLRLPVILMTFEPPTNTSIPELIAQYNLADFVIKRGDEQTSDFRAVAEIVARLLDEDKEDIESRLIANLRTQLPKIRRFAKKWLQLQGRDHDIPEMESLYKRLLERSTSGDLASLRPEVSMFRSKYGLPSV